ncbi:transcriptional repressor LexA [Lentisphaerota bacterium ZTH]|nr:repressor LexA [Lentisphaerota bacterium]WET05183.1 transcriptional repressor LexA [Lentisphaerota bacterium ZTH]
MKALTEKQKKILDYIEDFMEREGMAPTVYEIADFFSIKTSTVFAHLRALQRKNHLTRSSKARSISLNRPKRKPKHMSFILPIPLLGRINAGLPADSLEFKEGDIFVDSSLVSKKEQETAFALKVQGESMRDLGIYEDDVVIVKQTEDVCPGDIIVALINKDETTVKSYFPLRGGRVELRPANDEFSTQVYPSSHVKIQGKVIGLQRSY